jgi:rare lipoprotein A
MNLLGAKNLSHQGRRTNVCGMMLAVLALLPLAACVGPSQKTAKKTPEYINNETKFSSADYGVEGSPRVTTEKRPAKGTGRYQVGKPYQIAGKWYTPKEDESLKEIGLASWYGPNFHGRLTANGEIYDQFALTGAHPTMPLPSYAKVTNLENGRSLVVRINDRGPYAHGRVVDLSAQAAKMLGYDHQGVAKVKVEYAGKARMDGLDEQFLMASYQDPNRIGPGLPGPQPSTSGTMIALADTNPGNNDISRPAAAIDQGFSQTGSTVNLALSAIPVPISRPTLFEGIPMDGGEIGLPGEIVYQQVPRPLAYSGTEPIETLARFVPQDDLNHPYLGEMPARKIRLELGRFASTDDLVMLGLLYANAGWLEVDQASSKVVLVTVEKLVNQALQYSREIGLADAQIR